MKKKVTDFAFVNIPKSLIRPIKTAVARGIKKAQLSLGWEKKLSVIVVYNKNWATEFSGIQEYYQAIPLAPLGIMVVLNLAHHNESAIKKELPNLEESVVHEIIHLINSKPSAETNLLEFIILEGRAVYISQKILNLKEHEPIDSEGVRTTLRDMKKKLFENTNRVMDLEEGKYESEYNNYVFYELGYTIFSEYHAQNPDLTLIDLVKLPSQKLVNFTTKNFL